jgi:hypothetical protein
MDNTSSQEQGPWRNPGQQGPSLAEHLVELMEVLTSSQLSTQGSLWGNNGARQPTDHPHGHQNCFCDGSITLEGPFPAPHGR